ncbi:MAG: family NAD(P)-dependent oxidoreductase [Verrucomicrobia bacterium]|nr:family NAD(P)-dependent oxidoreductase [Verrucomicrobiota bacterium]
MNLVLTGSSSGIGRALAERLLDRGHSVWGIARSAQMEFAGQHPGKFRASRCDVTHWSQVEFAASEVASAWPQLDGLIACAGLQGEVGRTLSANPANWSATVRANLDGTFNTVRAFDALLKNAPRRAKVVCFSGGGATRPRPHFSAYGAAKTAVVRLVETIAEEERSRPYDINAVAPGGINTRLTDEILALGPDVAGPAEFAAAQKQKSSGGASIEKVVQLVEWLLSPASDGLSGKLLSAQWDNWQALENQGDPVTRSDLFTLRRISPGLPSGHDAAGKPPLRPLAG